MDLEIKKIDYAEWMQMVISIGAHRSHFELEIERRDGDWWWPLESNEKILNLFYFTPCASSDSFLMQSIGMDGIWDKQMEGSWLDKQLFVGTKQQLALTDMYKVYK